MSFLFKKPKQSPQQPPFPDNPRDLEEDGFILVGETEDERNAVTPDKRDVNQDLPPMYQFAEGSREYGTMNTYHSSPPVYESYAHQNSSNQQAQNTRENQARNHPDSSNLQGQNPTAKTPLHDIPFKIDDSVTCAFNFGRYNVDIGDDFAWTTAQYNYDFTMERSILQQTGPL